MIVFLSLIINVVTFLESRCNNYVSNGNSHGLMQIHTDTAVFIWNKYQKKFGVLSKITNKTIIKHLLYNPIINLETGKQYLLFLSYNNKTFIEFINAYNTGNWSSNKSNENHFYIKEFKVIVGKKYNYLENLYNGNKSEFRKEFLEVSILPTILYSFRLARIQLLLRQYSMLMSR